MAAQHPNLDAFLARLKSVRPAGGGWKACCPAHGDEHPSLDVSIGRSGRILAVCRSAGCSFEAIVRAVGMELRDFAPPDALPRPSANGVAGHTGESFEARLVCAYDYRDEAGGLLYQSVRLRDPKDFRQRRPTGARLVDGRHETVWSWKVGKVRRVPYRLPQLLVAPPEAWILCVEGEKDADALAGLGLHTTTNAQGAGRWHTLDAAAVEAAFRGRRVAIFPDHDAAGLSHAVQVAQALAPIAAEVRVVELPGLQLHGDVSDWLEGLE